MALVGFVGPGGTAIFAFTQTWISRGGWTSRPRTSASSPLDNDDALGRRTVIWVKRAAMTPVFKDGITRRLRGRLHGASRQLDEHVAVAS